ncbi:hypothetical protein CSTERLE_11425 [Thermoclostridium stercorarium subsp. leptospartum DSM 9219]|jgi:tetratricopeptide (TPR) repeat protein|uniref:DUF5107 domain-containing protein n=2 Tax=Thermoclostridium stercorarium TaxID=1510 RepID=A0A1B1YN14_THEST|nr:DUF5107 domain-containing protein [Thermoclostridium stercorarium]ANX02134.1 hypothetical protein CSTERLE_11425 [Thermoclostridium stercorarium subsp. leptospartum DSM 9219]
MNGVKAWVEKVIIPTYGTGEPEKVPMFLEKRVYQGSSGKVYPYPVIEKICDEKKDKEYTAVFLENEYLKVMVLPELGGRIQRAYDKTNGFDFVYHNRVIKPALVGLLGPWISGGIEFNWPQHHRPTTFLPVDFILFDNEDGSKSVLLHDVDQMYGTKAIVKITLYPGKAYIEITGQLYNRTHLPQTFLWWANPAFPANENTQSIFPPDVHAVMDHGKRDVSRFPVATGIYYKKDYSEGVDISRYKNIPVPTSFMAEKSKYDFIGGYDHGKKAGILHVADHHISPGKKQWTWGCGDFGKAWERNLTDEDGPYIELMTGVYTDNQPDFSWLKPFEEKTFRQYFMPYKEIGQVKNATAEAAINLSCNDEEIFIAAYATGVYENAEVVLTYGLSEIFRENVKLSPVDVYKRILKKKELGLGKAEDEKLKLRVFADGKCLVEYQPEPEEIQKMPEPAKAAKDPTEIMTNEELYLTGLHIEQYRHATYLPDPYYLEGLKRDPGDIRINNAYGLLLMRRGDFANAEKHFRTALKRLTERNPNPYNSESYYLLGLVLLYQGRDEEAYDAFYKATWSNEQQEMSYYFLAAIDAKKGNFTKALEHVERGLVKNSHNIKARGLKAYILRKLGRINECKALIEENLRLDPFDFVSGNEKVIINGNSAELRVELNRRMRNFHENYLMTARDYAEFGAYEEAVALLNECTGKYPMLKYYEAYYRHLTGESDDNVRELINEAESRPTDYCFPNKPEDIAVLRFAIDFGNGVRAKYYLGNLYYDKLQWQKAVLLWEEAAEAEPDFYIIHRNLAVAYYNKLKARDKAKAEMEKAFRLNPRDERVFMELDQLYKKLGMSFEERLKNYEAHKELIERRDDLYTEYVTLLNMCGYYEKAYECIMGHRFHPWEGGEGKIATQYKLSLLEMAAKAKAEGHFCDAERLLRQALVYPENLGEGKLEGTKDNHIYYNLGLVLEALGKIQEAKECYERATEGNYEPKGIMYYYDQPADMILYQGLAYQKLGRIAEAKSRFYRLIDYGEQHLDDEVKIDYFAVSLPDFGIFEEDYTIRNRAHCFYLMALGNIGLGNFEKAKNFLDEAVKIEPSHMMCRVYQRYLADRT